MSITQRVCDELKKITLEQDDPDSDAIVHKNSLLLMDQRWTRTRVTKSKGYATVLGAE
jgi:hypothetical protein